MARGRVREERGAVAVMTAASMVFVVAAAALAVDVGHITFRKRWVQGVSDLMALDAVRAVGDRYVPGSNLQAAAQTFAEESAKRNGFEYTDQLHDIVSVEVGELDFATNTFTTPPSSDAYANAVRVVLSSNVGHGFLPGTSRVEVEAIAANDAMAGFRIGSSLARFDPTVSPLGAILDGMVGISLDAAGYESLVGASVTLGDLWAELGLGSSDQILNGQVTMADLVDATIAALNADGSPSSVAAATALAGTTGTVDGSSTFTFGDMFEIATGSTKEVVSARINVLEMITAAATIANGGNLVDVDLPIDVPGVTLTNLKMGVIEPAKRAFGPARRNANGDWVTSARTAQVRMQLRLTLSEPLTVLGTALTVTVPVYLEAGGARGELTGIDCLIPETASPVDILVATSTSQGYVGKVNDATLSGGTVTVQDADIVSYPALLTATGSSSYEIAGSSQTLTFVGPFDEPPPPGARPTQSVGATNPDLDQLAADLTLSLTSPNTVVNSSLSLITQNLRSMVVAAIEEIDDEVLAPLINTPLGIQFGGTDVTNTSLECNLRRLMS